MVHIIGVCFGLSNHIIEPALSLVWIGHTQIEPRARARFIANPTGHLAVDPCRPLRVVDAKAAGRGRRNMPPRRPHSFSSINSSFE